MESGGPRTVDPLLIDYRLRKSSPRSPRRLDMIHDSYRLLVPLFGVILLVVLVAKLRVHAFIALLIVSLLVGLASSLEPIEIVRAFSEGVGGVLRSIAAVVGLGTVLGKLLAE